jgi:hypothetical protein
MESRVESFENSDVIIRFCGVLCLDSIEDVRKNSNKAHQRKGEIIYIIIAIDAPVIIPPGMVRSFSLIIMNKRGKLKIIPQNKACIR